MADAYLKEVVRDLPIGLVVCGRKLRPEVSSYVSQGVVQVIAGPEMCHVVIDIQRPYHRPKRKPLLPKSAPDAPHKWREPDERHNPQRPRN
ncbi:hypothetical protein PhaeoP88_04691 (plasmid) [Phaeobacter inhibens]|uniref:Uncharacterized protein n=1 Tax=Phaeobacter inhibens TaxID=221822 RepID=A0A2I7KHD1_9RHOB|nr:hypothetical protein PhaeoP88_04691 [Phaeobacter inhibens]